MATTIAVLSQKGGTGKTTTVRTLTDVFRRIGLDTLAVDLDPQGNLSDYLDVDPAAEPTVGDVLTGRAKAADAIHDDVLPANLGLAEAELTLGGKMGRELTLRKALREVKDGYDVVLIDCPPALGLLTVNALVAADFALLRTPGGANIPATVPLDDPGLRVGESRQLTPPPSRALARASTSGDVEPQDPDAIAWVIPKDDGSQCLIAYLTDVQQFGTGCAHPADAAAGRFVITLSRTGEDAGIYGLMPDGVDSVTVDLADGSSAELPVVDNAYMALFDRPTEAVRWTDAGGVEQTVRIGSGG